MQRRVTITPYNRQAIKNWHEELKDIPAKIVAQEGIVSEHENKIMPLKQNLFSIQKEINRIDIEITRRRRTYETEQRHHYEYHHNDHDTADLIQDAFESFTGDPELNALRHARNSYIPGKEELEKKISLHQAEVDNAKDTIRSLKSKRKKIADELIPGAEKFLSDLKDNPESLFRNFRCRIEKELRCYHKKHFDQEPVVRDVFIKLTEKLDAILESDINITHGNYEQLYLVENERKEWQIKYAILCGYLWDVLYELEFKNCQDAHFKDVLRSLLKETHIIEHGDLPDEFNTGSSTINQYETYKIKYKDPELYKHYSDEELDHFELKEYENARTEFYKVAKDSYDKSTKLAQDIHADLQRPRKKNEEPPNISLYTRTLTLEKEILSMPPKDRPMSEAALELADIADHISGKPSTCKKVLGGIVFFLGATVVGGSVLSAIGTFGGSTPISGFGIAMGASLVTYGLTLLGLGVGVTATIGGGMLFKSGMRHGISKDVKQALDEANAPDEPGAFSRPRYA